MDELRLTLVQIHPSVSVIFFSSTLFPQNQTHLGPHNINLKIAYFSPSVYLSSSSIKKNSNCQKMSICHEVIIAYLRLRNKIWWGSGLFMFHSISLSYVPLHFTCFHQFKHSLRHSQKIFFIFEKYIEMINL
jgi:hypothetical protein